MNWGKFVLVLVELVLIVLPPLLVAFPKRSGVFGRSLVSRAPSFKTFRQDQNTVLTMSILRLSSNWLTQTASSRYLLASLVLAVLVVVAYWTLGISLIILLVALLVLELTAAPYLAVKLVEYTLRDLYKKERLIYESVLIHALILISAELKTAMTLENIISKLPRDLPSSATQRLVEDVRTFRQRAESTDQDTSMANAIIGIGEFWNIDAIVLIGNLLQQPGLSELDAADQMASQVSRAYGARLIEDSRYYKSREVISTFILLFSFVGVTVLAIAPVMLGALSSLKF